MNGFNNYADAAAHELARFIETSISTKDFDSKIKELVQHYRRILIREGNKNIGAFNDTLVLKSFQDYLGFDTPEDYFYSLDGNDDQEDKSQITDRTKKHILDLVQQWKECKETLRGDSENFTFNHKKLANITQKLVDIQKRYSFPSLDEMITWIENQGKETQTNPYYREPWHEEALREMKEKSNLSKEELVEMWANKYACRNAIYEKAYEYARECLLFVTREEVDRKKL